MKIKIVLALIVVSGFFVVIKPHKLFMYSEATTQDTFYDQSKLWKHHVYTVSEIKKALETFQGIETDVVFDEGHKVFDIRHDESSEFRSRNLETLFKATSEKDDVYFWLDFKNLTSVNLLEARGELFKLLDKYNLKNKVIVESPHIELLHEFADNSVSISYWIPHFPVNSDKLWKYYERAYELRKKMHQYKVNALSANYEMMPYLEYYFSESNIHIWTNGLEGVKGKEKIKGFDKKNFVKVILVDYDKNFID